MATVASLLISHVRDELDESTAAFWTDNQVLRMLSRAERELCTEAPVLERVHSTDLVANTSLYNFHANAVELDRVEVNGKKARIIDIRDIDRLLGRGGTAPNTTDGSANYVYIWNRQMGLHPTPSAAATSGLVYWSYDFPSAISSIGESISVPDEFAFTLIPGASAIAFRKRREWEASAFYEAKFESEIAKIRAVMQRKRQRDRKWKIRDREKDPSSSLGPY